MPLQAAPEPAFVTVRGLRKRYGAVTAVDGVSLSVREGHTLALLGPSGCGKTTVLRCIAGLETPDDGHVSLAGRVVFDQAIGIELTPQRRELGIVFQSYAIWPHMSVGENIGFPLKVRKIGRGESRERVSRVLDMVGLKGVIDRPATELSGGQQQRVALARALVHEPRLVLFDEPMSNLDAQLRDEVRTELKVLQRRLGFTAIYVTHDQSEAFALAETVAVMSRGRIETADGPRALFERPKTAFVARFLGLNVLPGRVLRADERTTGPCHVEVALTDRHAVRALIAEDRPMPTDAGVLLCVRKEHIGLRRLKPGEAVAAGALVGEVRAASFLGIGEEYAVMLGDAELRAVQPPAGIKAGDRVEVTIRPENALVFRADEAGSGR